MISDLIKVEDRVAHILRKYPQTRDSDKKLWLAYNVLFNDLKEVMSPAEYSVFREWLLRDDTPVFESLSRMRRKLQEKDKSIAGNRVKRMEEAENVRQWSHQ